MTSVDRRRTATRDALVAAALVLFRRQGVSGTGVAEVCAAAGVSKGVFAHHFPDGKAALVAAALDRNAADLRAMLDRAARRGDGTVGGFVREFFDGYARAMRALGADVGCPMAAAAVDGGAGVAGEVLGGAVRGWSELVAAAEPRLRGHEEALLVALEGALVVARATADPAVLSRAGQRVADAV